MFNSELTYKSNFKATDGNRLDGHYKLFQLIVELTLHSSSKIYYTNKILYRQILYRIYQSNINSSVRNLIGIEIFHEYSMS